MPNTSHKGERRTSETNLRLILADLIVIFYSTELLRSGEAICAVGCPHRLDRTLFNRVMYCPFYALIERERAGESLT